MSDPKKIPYGIVNPDPFDFDPEDFTEDELDHGDGNLEPDGKESDDE